MRIKAVIAYDGSEFEGFQRQNRTDRTVTGAIENTLKSVGIESPVTGSGRTDAGVHATGQVIHFDLPSYWQDQSLARLQTHINRKLKSIRFKHICRAADDFHARYDARERIYRYIFRDNPSIFERRYVSSLGMGDSSLLQTALEQFVGEHDFIYFHKTGSDPLHSRRTVFKAYTRRLGPYRLIYFHADGFLRAQVRMMIYAAAAASLGRLTISSLREQIDGRHRHLTTLAPPQGLYLARVLYK